LNSSILVKAGPFFLYMLLVIQEINAHTVGQTKS